MKGKLSAGIAAALVLTAMAALAIPKVLPIGAVAPDFTLKDLQGKDYTLSQLTGSIVVIDFTSIECPYCKGVDGHFVNMPAQYKDKPVVFFQINSIAEQTPDKIKQYVADKNLGFAVLKDDGTKYADAFGAARTPEFFVLDKDLKVAYHGAYDNRKAPSKAGDINYVSNAIDDLLAGRAVQTPEVDAFGCRIQRAK